jgi:hypothetical protein
MDYDTLYKSYLAEFTVADAGLAGDADFAYNSDDTYAPGDARIPKALGATISRKGKVKKKRKKKLNEIKTIHDYLIMPPAGDDQENIVNNIAVLKSNPNEVYRGMSSAEYKNLLKHKKVVSRGAGNTRKGITGSYVSDSIQLAGRFAFTEYKQKGRAFLLSIDRDKLPDLNPADEGNYWTSNLPLDAVNKVYNLQDLAK